MLKKTSNIDLQKVLLLISAIGLIPIALSYGLVPEKTLTPLFGFSVDNMNLTHIMRAVMGLYFGQIVFWFIGAFNPKLRRPAMYVLVVFMLGLAFGRFLSIILDGIPHWLLIVYLGLELTIGLTGLFILKKEDN
ncbi:MAG: DUF4345 domain-containing protein [Bacteroidales bacterium]|nr:DUF4345 domain-containing protein [Bacteroidales bacterium]